MKVPTLLIVYNRADMVLKLIEALRIVKPTRIWISADAPRSGDLMDKIQCRLALDALSKIDWPCEIRRQVASEHLGCKRGPIQALDWFFSEVENGVVLEDDCIPDPTFFSFCEELLARYEKDEDVMMITGTNFGNDEGVTTSYIFSRYGHMWGWATWRRAWRLYDRDIRDWPERKASGWLRTISANPRFESWWTQLLDWAWNGELEAWGPQWGYAVFKNGGFAIIPSQNLISNLGFDHRATHTFDLESPIYNMPKGSMPFPLLHPSKVEMIEHRMFRPSATPIEMFPFRPSKK